jgi:hypothetical protein
LLGLPDNMSSNIPCYNDTREQRTDDAQQLQESDDPSSSSQMSRAEEIGQNIPEKQLSSDSQESAVFSTSLLPKPEVLEQKGNPSEDTCDDLRHFKNSFSTQPANTEVLDQNFTRHKAEDTCGVKQPAAVLIYPLLPKAEVLDQSIQEQNANAQVSPSQNQTVYLVTAGFPQAQSSSVPKTQSSSVPKTQRSPVQKPKGQRRRRVCTKADCPFCNILPCGACRPCTNPDSRSRCIFRWVSTTFCKHALQSTLKRFLSSLRVPDLVFLLYFFYSQLAIFYSGI